ncbi:hypothetical protein D3C81_1905700 [compost metagenome]
MPIRFCSTAKTLAISRNNITCLPLTRSKRTLALMPKVVKKATIKGVLSVVSISNSVTCCPCAHHTARATNRPPTTGSGRL